MRAARRAQQTRLVKEISDLIETNEFNLSTLQTILQRLEKSTNELTKINGELHAEMSDDEVAADYDSVLEYEDQAAGALGLLRHHILELSNPPTTGTGVRVEPPPIQPPSALPSGENGHQANDDQNLRPTAEEDLDLLQYFRVEVDCRERTAHGLLEGSSRQYLLPGSGRRQTPLSSAAVLKNSATETCVFCEKRHATSECDSSLDHNEKRRLLTASGSCFRCTTKGHRAQDCRRKGNVSAFTLQQRPPVERASLASNADRMASDNNCRHLPTTYDRRMCARYCRATCIDRAPPSTLRLEQI
ncbi:hypothetical protein HPB49_009077 [Dermacentor silvarum]|uniref:Uncharacterized protein n=1 Tax=Dermacentor silvarum TaxID=543639 RepID=A0ACB8DZ23_DERSI|nr:hypothetical protein HPB49_009077 [Dermacentor silvarum]